jgi:hypothetical protein
MFVARHPKGADQFEIHATYNKGAEGMLGSGAVEVREYLPQLIYNQEFRV